MFISKLVSKPLGVYTFFGVPGSGKTTFAAAIAKECFRRGIPVYSNVPILGAYVITRADIGHYNLPLLNAPVACLILDECGLVYNNRNFKSNFTSEALEWWKLHRHYKDLIFTFSQGYSDLDLKIRQLTQQYFHVEKHGPFIQAMPIYYDTGVNEEKHEMQDLYFYEQSKFFRFINSTFIYSKRYWDMFDSYDAPYLPDLPLKKYTSKNAEVKIFETVKISETEDKTG